MFVVVILWVLFGGLGCWLVHRRAAGRMVRCLGFASCIVVFFVPVAWLTAGRIHWWWIQPRIGEPLDAVVTRLGVAEPTEHGEWRIGYTAPRYWIVPVHGWIDVSTDSAGLVTSWTGSWR